METQWSLCFRKSTVFKKIVFLRSHIKIKTLENLLEIACFEITSAETALRSVADRIEFCAEQHLGGTTPNIDEFRYLNNIYKKPIFVMIRPKGGDFFYSDLDFLQMKKSII